MSIAATIAPPRAALGTRHAGATLAAAVLGFFVVTLDAVAVNVALPSIRGDFGGGLTGLQWTVDGYTLMFAALLLSAGALSDRIGARRTFAFGIGLFAVASIGCGVAPAMGALVAARFVQGSAAALIMPSSLALIGQAYMDPIRRGRAIAVWAMGGAVASSCGPLLGGALTVASWRAIFFLNVPAGAAALLLIARAEPSARRWVPFDVTGQLTAVVAMGALTFGAIEGGDLGFADLRVCAAFAVALTALVVFVRAQARGPHPMMPLELFRPRNVTIAMVVGFAFIVGYYGLPFVMSLYLQQQRGLSPFGTGIAFLPMMLVGLLLTPFSARIAERLGARLLITMGLASMTTGLVLLALRPSAPVWQLATVMALVGIAGPLVMPPMTAVLLNSVPNRQAGTASGVFNTSRQIGGALAIAVFGALLGNTRAFVEGMRLSLLVAAGTTAAAAFVATAIRDTNRAYRNH